MNTAPLVDMLSQITPLSRALEEGLSEELQQERYKPHQILRGAGHLEDRVYFMETGFARDYYYDHHGEEHTVKIWEPGNILFSYEGYYQVPSYFYTEVMADAHFITLSYAELHSLCARYPEVSVLIKTILLQYQQEEYEKQKLIALPAKERFLQLHQKRPMLFQHAPLRIIASYLNMTRETLTRLIGKSAKQK